MRFLICLLFPQFLFAVSISQKLKALDPTPAVRVTRYMMHEQAKIGKIVASQRTGGYLTNEDIVYLSVGERGLSEGDRFSIFRDDGEPKVAYRGTNGGHRFSLKGYLKVTKVLKNTVAAVIYNAQEDISLGDFIGEFIDPTVDIVPKEPLKSVKGRIIAAAADQEIGGTHDLIFLDKGSDDGLEKNDRLIVFRPGGEEDKIGADLEIPVAQMVVVHTDKKFATAYISNAVDGLRSGDRFKSDISEAKYLK